MLVFQLKALDDNYVYVLRDEATELTAVIDPSVSAPVFSFLKEKKWRLDYILNTHHHWDHVGGNLELQKTYDCEVVGYEGDKARLPGVTQTLKDGEIFRLGKSEAKVIFIPGHTTGHIAYYFEKEKALFPGDTLFSLGCGRLFEGTYEQMFHSLSLLKKLPDDTKVYCAHEYTLTNARFLQEIEPSEANNKNYATLKGKLENVGSTIPSTLEFEKRYNPYMRASGVQAFREVRDKKDAWRG